MASQRTEHLAMRTGLVKAGRPPIAVPSFRLQASLVAGYLALYLLLDWASMIYPFLGYNITPWNPPPGLSLTLLFIFGLRYGPLLVVAGVLSDSVLRGLVAPFHVSLLANLVNAAGYTALAWLLRHRLRLNPDLESVRDMALLTAAALFG